MGLHRQWPTHSFLAADARTTICNSFSGPMASCKDAVQTEEQDIEKWLRGTINWTGSAAVSRLKFSLWLNQLTPCLPSHLSSQARLCRLRKQSRRVRRPLPDLLKNLNNPFLVIRP